jgi:hypothetical protein
MGVAVIQPTREAKDPVVKEEKPMSDLDKVLLALKIANETSGLAVNLTKVHEYMGNSGLRDSQRAGAAQEVEKNSMLLGATKSAQERRDNQQLNASELQEAMANKLLDVSDKETPDSIKYQILGPKNLADRTPAGEDTTTPRYKYISQKVDLKEASQIKKDDAMADYYKSAASKNTNEAGNKENEFKKLPKENQIMIDIFAKNAVKQSTYGNKFSEFLKTMRDPKVSEDLKRTAGQEFLKVLNSSKVDNPDAVGKDERENMASFLKFKVFNFTAPGKWVGTDVVEFEKQMAIAADSVRSSFNHSKAQIKRLSTGESITFDPFEKMPSLKSEYQKSMDLDGKQVPSASPTFKQAPPAFQTTPAPGVPALKFNPSRPFKEL